MASLLPGLLEILLAAQATGALLTGTVRDADTGRPLPGALVVLADLELSALADSAGRYQLADVPAGPQHVAVRLLGYAPRTLHALVPREGRLEINISLSPEPIPLPALEARGRVEMRGGESERTDPFPARQLTMRAVRNHPLLTEADVFSALAGVEAAVSPEAPRGVHLRGGAADQTAFLLDGIPVFNPYHAAGMFSAWNPDAIAGIELFSAALPPDLPDVLSGAVAATTRSPGTRLQVQGGLSTTQARVTVDGPFPAGGPGHAGYLVSLRSGYPGVLTPRNDASHIHGETWDGFAKVEGAAFGGRLRVLGYDSENELDATALVAEGEPVAGRNRFGWVSRSIGVDWSRDLRGGAVVRVRGWSAGTEASAAWAAADAGVADLATSRQDEGALLEVERADRSRVSTAGLRVERSRTSYRVEDGGSGLAIDARTPVASAFARLVRPLGARIAIELAGALLAADGKLHWGPRVRVGWDPAAALRLSASWARLHQFSQSLRNAESVAGSIFPVDLHVGAGAAGVPVADNSQWVFAADLTPVPGLRIGAQAHTVASNGLLLAAPSAGGPFSVTGFTIGRGRARGVSLEAAATGSRAGFLASWVWQAVRFEYLDSSYVPDHGARHVIETGVIVFPSATSSIRLGASSAFGRRATAVDGAFEWEACNLLDRGCEFGGSPRADTAALGGTRLPGYLRVDLGARKHWHVKLRGRDATLGLFASITNVFGRRNVLTFTTDPVSGERGQIDMRPRAPLAIGLDWRF